MNFSTLSSTLKAAAFGAAMMLTANAQAAPLNLSLETETPAPDTLTTLMNSSYSADSDLLSIDHNGFSAFSFRDENGNNFDITDGTFSLNAYIDDNGIFSRGSFTIGGTIAAKTYTSGTLLQGDLTNFGYSYDSESGSSTFEFTFDVIGNGDASSLYLANSYIGGMIIDDLGFEGTFGSDFSETTFTKIDTGVISPVPEPQTVALFALGLLTVMGFARRQSKLDA